MKWINFVLFVCLCGLSCDKPCPEDIKLGDIPLMASSLKSIPYVKGQIIKFINLASDTLAYEVSDLGIYDRSTYLGNLCESKETNANLYTNSTQLNVKLRLEDTDQIPNIGIVINFNLDVGLHNLNQNNPLDTQLVDILDICSTIKGAFRTGLKTAHNRLKTVIHSHNSADKMIHSFYNQATYLAKIELNGQVFLEVYQQGEDSKKIYYNFDKGIIGFEDGNEELWLIL